ncbi:MAG: hypothetical protein BGO77_03545 [Caedibacter sp. 37-49]|nr:MAG: hypothetical protein BGO77_03545 [Caedibacter sp. 37-49]
MNFPRNKAGAIQRGKKGLGLQQIAKTKKLAFYHHNPAHTVDILFKIEQEAQKQWKKCFFAYQGMKISFP